MARESRYSRASCNLFGRVGQFAIANPAGTHRGTISRGFYVQAAFVVLSFSSCGAVFAFGTGEATDVLISPSGAGEWKMSNPRERNGQTERRSWTG